MSYSLFEPYSSTRTSDRPWEGHLLQAQPQRIVDQGSVLEDGPQARELPLLGGRAGSDQCLTIGIPEWLQSRDCCRPPGLPLFKGKGLQPLPSSCIITVWARGGGGSWRPGAHGLLQFKALLTKKSHTQTWENQILWKQTVWREGGVQGIIRDQRLRGGRVREKLNCLASPARPPVTPFRVVLPPPQEVQALCSPTLFLLPKHRGRLHFTTKEARTQVNIHLILYLLNHCCSNSGQQAGCIRNIWGFTETRTHRGTSVKTGRQHAERNISFFEVNGSAWGEKPVNPCLLGTNKDSKNKTKEDMDDKI